MTSLTSLLSSLQGLLTKADNAPGVVAGRSDGADGGDGA
jgi:hypothetical protein